MSTADECRVEERCRGSSVCDVFRGVSTADICSDVSAEERYERECKVSISHLHVVRDEQM